MPELREVREVREQGARYLAQPAVTGTLVDSCILIDVLAGDPPVG